MASVKAGDHMWAEQLVTISLESALLSMRSSSSFLPQCGSRSESKPLRIEDPCGSVSESWSDFAVTESWIDFKNILYVGTIILSFRRYSGYNEVGGGGRGRAGLGRGTAGRRGGGEGGKYKG